MRNQRNPRGTGLTRRTFLAATTLVGVGAGATPAQARDTESGTLFDTAPAANALRRLVPRHHRQIALRATAPAAADTFRVTGTAGRIEIEGTTPAVLLTGFRRYLRDVAHADISWNGEQLDLPARLPAPSAPLVRTANVPHRFAGNDTADAYTGPYRTWPEWERELDVLALHGINAVLVYTGQEAVYRDAFRGFGYTDVELRAWIPGPAHQPWWLLQNISGFGGPVSEQLLQARTALGRKIVTRLRELGMTPVFPGYFGTVPPDFTARNGGAHTVPQGTWGGFRRPDWLDPRDPAFAPVATAFYRRQSELFGDTTMYKMDLLHEGGDPGDVPVGDAAGAVEHALRTAHPGAVWNILGWQTNPRKEILGAVDKERMFIVDGLSDRFPNVTDRESDWQGTPYAFGSIWNFGGHTAMGANTPDWAELYPAWRDKKDSALAGIAMMPEANDNNPAAMALLTDLAWAPGKVDLEAWFAGHATARYGGDDPHARAAWEALRTSAYGTTRADSWAEGQDGLFAARPSLTAASAAAWSPQEMRYDATRFGRALTELLQVAPALRGSSAYRYDLLDVARQTLANRGRALLPDIKDAYDAEDRGRFSDLTGEWLELTLLLDTLMATSPQTLLGRWLDAARAWGDDAAERDLLEYDARSLLTTWAGRKSSDEGLHDYANREWAGLVGDFYHGRWKTYFAELNTALADGREPADIDWYAHEDAWNRSRKRYPVMPAGDTYDVAARVAARLGLAP